MTKIKSITIKRAWTEQYQIAPLKADIEEFKKSWTVEDVINVTKQAAKLDVSGYEILNVKCEAFPGNWQRYNGESMFGFTIVIETIKDYKWVIYKIETCVDGGLNVHDPHDVRVRTFKEI